MGGVIFSEDAADRIVDAVRYVESHRPTLSRPRAQAATPASLPLVLVRIVNSTTAEAVAFDPTTSTFVAYAQAQWATLNPALTANINNVGTSGGNTANVYVALMMPNFFGAGLDCYFIVNTYYLNIFVTTGTHQFVPSLQFEQLSFKDIASDGIVKLSINNGGSIVNTGAYGVALDGDAATPGASKFYGTNGSGVKGWQAFPGGVTGTFGG